MALATVGLTGLGVGWFWWKISRGPESRREPLSQPRCHVGLWSLMALYCVVFTTLTWRSYGAYNMGDVDLAACRREKCRLNFWVFLGLLAGYKTAIWLKNLPSVGLL